MPFPLPGLEDLITSTTLSTAEPPDRDWQRLDEYLPGLSELVQIDGRTHPREIERRLEESRAEVANAEEPLGMYISERSIPGWSLGRQIGRNIRYAAARDRLREGRPEPGDYDLITDTERLQQIAQDRSTGGRILDIAARIPAFAGEFAATSGMFRAGSGAAQAGVRGAMAPTAARGYVRGAAGLVGGAAAQTAANVPLVAERITSRMADQDESFLSAIGPGAYDAFVEVLTEQSGAGLMRGVTRGTGFVANRTGATALVNRLGGERVGQWMEQGVLNRALRAGRQLGRTTGFHGIPGEYLEERFGELLRLPIDERMGATGNLLRGELGEFLNQSMIEGAAFSIWGGAMGGIGALAHFRRGTPEGNLREQINAEVQRLNRTYGPWDRGGREAYQAEIQQAQAAQGPTPGFDVQSAYPAEAEQAAAQPVEQPPEPPMTFRERQERIRRGERVGREPTEEEVSQAMEGILAAAEAPQEALARPTAAQPTPTQVAPEAPGQAQTAQGEQRPTEQPPAQVSPTEAKIPLETLTFLAELHGEKPRGKNETEEAFRKRTEPAFRKMYGATGLDVVTRSILGKEVPVTGAPMPYVDNPEAPAPAPVQRPSPVERMRAAQGEVRAAPVAPPAKAPRPGVRTEIVEPGQPKPDVLLAPPVLNAREQEIIDRRKRGESQEKIGKDLGITRQRVEQIEKAARKKLQEHLSIAQQAQARKQDRAAETERGEVSVEKKVREQLSPEDIEQNEAVARFLASRPELGEDNEAYQALLAAGHSAEDARNRIREIAAQAGREGYSVLREREEAEAEQKPAKPKPADVSTETFFQPRVEQGTMFAHGGNVETGGFIGAMPEAASEALYTPNKPLSKRQKGARQALETKALKQESERETHAHWAQEAESIGMDPAGVRALAEEIRREEEEQNKEINDIARTGRRFFAQQGLNITAEKYSDYINLPKFDGLLTEMERDYPGIFPRGYSRGGAAEGDAGSTENAQKLFEMIKEGRIEPMSLDQAYNEAMTRILEGRLNRGQAADQGADQEGAEEAGGAEAAQGVEEAESAAAAEASLGEADVGDFDPTTFGAPITEEELRRGGLGGGSGLATGGRPLRIHAAANAKMDEQRQKDGLPPLFSAARQANAKLWDKAMERLDADPTASAQLVDELTKKNRVTSDLEELMLLHRRIALTNEHQRAMRAQIQALREKADEAVINAMEVKERKLFGMLDQVDKVMRKTGTEIGRALQIRRQMVKEDYTLAGMLMRAMAAKGRELTRDEVVRIGELQQQIEKLRQRVKELESRGDKKGAADADFEGEQLRKGFERELRSDYDSRAPLHTKVMRAADEAMNIPRSVMASIDFPLLRQGMISLVTKPIQTSKKIPLMFKAFASHKTAERALYNIRHRPNALLYEQSGLEITDQFEAVSEREEEFLSRLMRDLHAKPGLAGKAAHVATFIPRASERAYQTILNELRADMFDSLASNLSQPSAVDKMFGIKAGEITRAEAKVIANLVNVATGRGNVSAIRGAMPLLNRMFFSPRWAVSRLQLLIGQPLWSNFGERAPRARLLVAKQYAKLLVGMGLLYGLFKLWGLTEDDPRSSDFGKVRVGNTRLDFTGGMAGTFTFLNRVFRGTTKSSTGEIRHLSGPQHRQGQDETWDVISRFLRSKLAPVPGTAVDVWPAIRSFGAETGTNVVGEPVTAGGAVLQLTTPLFARDVYEALNDLGVPKGTIVSLFGLLGSSMQTYQLRDATVRSQLRHLTSAPPTRRRGETVPAFQQRQQTWQENRERARVYLDREGISNDERIRLLRSNTGRLPARISAALRRD